MGDRNLDRELSSTDSDGTNMWRRQDAGPAGTDLGRRHAAGPGLPEGEWCVRGRLWVTRPGFTFVELVMVLVALGVLATLMLPRVPLARYRMDGSVRGVAAALVAAQRVAVKKQHDVVVSFETSEGQIWIHEDADNDGQTEAGERLRVLSLDDQVTFGRGGAPARSIGASDITFTQTQGGRSSVTFHRNGSAGEAGGLYLTTKQAEVESGHEGHCRSVEVDRATGRTSWYYYNTQDSAWHTGF